ncbi:hypothetical protein OROMI_002985 [Orobanche minor]
MENIQFKAFQDEGIEPDLESKMDQLFGVSVAQGAFKFTPVERAKETTNVPSLPMGPSPFVYIPTPPSNIIDLNDCDAEMSENVSFSHNQVTRDWQDVWNDYTQIPSHSPSPIEHANIGRKGSFEHDVTESSKSRRTENGRKGGAVLLMEKIDSIVKVVTERNVKDMELMSLQARALDDSSHTC